MKLLLYCVLRNDAQPSPELTVDAVRAIPCPPTNLIAIVAERDAQAINPTIQELLAFENIVAGIHQTHTIIPMRYGCWFDDEQQLGNFLISQQSEYQTLLNELDDCVEMSLRILMIEATTKPDAPAREHASSGRAYLTARRSHYAHEQAEAAARQERITRFCEPLTTIAKRRKDEMKRVAEGWLYSQFFLIPRADLANWNDKLRQLEVPETVKFSATGPWPPHNFVTPEKLSPNSSLLQLH